MYFKQRWAVFGLGILALAALPLRVSAAPSAEVLATGFTFPEGPALSRDGHFLYVVNVQSADISRIDLRSGAVLHQWMVLPQGGRGNGGTLGPDGALYIADVGRRSIDRIDTKTRDVTTVVNHNEQGGDLKGPNDLIFDRKGGVYFTDPEGSQEQPIGKVYYVAPKTHAVSLVAAGLRYPNGLVLSRDQKTLYVGETPLSIVDAIDVTATHPAGPQDWKVFAHVPGPDGMRWGPNGNLYAASYGLGELTEVNPAGQIVAQIPVPPGKGITNLCFTRDGRTIYVTLGGSNAVSIVHLK